MSDGSMQEITRCVIKIKKNCEAWPCTAIELEAWNYAIEKQWATSLSPLPYKYLLCDCTGDAHHFYCCCTVQISSNNPLLELPAEPMRESERKRARSSTLGLFFYQKRQGPISLPTVFISFGAK